MRNQFQVGANVCLLYFGDKYECPTFISHNYTKTIMNRSINK